MTLEDLIRQHGFSQASFQPCKAKSNGLSVHGLKRLKELEEANRRLKQMDANLSLEPEALKDMVEKILRAEARRQLAKCWLAGHGLSERQACRAVPLYPCIAAPMAASASPKKRMILKSCRNGSAWPKARHAGAAKR